MDVYGRAAEPAPLDGWIRPDARTFVVNPPVGLLSDVVDRVGAVDGEPVRVLLSPTVVDELGADFVLEKRLAGTRQSRAFAVREAELGLEDRLLLSGDDVGVVVPVGDRVGIFENDGGALAAALREKYDSVWAAAEPVTTRAPSTHSMTEAAEERLSDRFVTDFRAAIEGAGRLEWHGRPTPVELALVTAARAEEHLYDVSRWGEDADFASRSSLSRSKNDLDDAGLLDVERDPQERGRPRQRLVPGAEPVAEADARELVSVVQTLLEEE